MIRVLGFKNEYRPDGKVIEWVHFTSGDAFRDNGETSHSTWERVARLMPPSEIENHDGGDKLKALQAQWAQIEPAYRAWKAGNEIPEDGTPLGAWPALDQDQAAALRTVGFRTVEDVANATENQLARPPLPQMRDLQRQAKLFLDGRGKAELEEKLRRLEEQNAAMLEMLAERDVDKPRRGRPPKAREEEAA